MTGLSADLKLLAQSKDAFALDRSDYEFNSLSHHILHFPGHEASPFQKDLLPQSVRDALSQTVKDALSLFTHALGYILSRLRRLAGLLTLAYYIQL